MTPTMIAGLCFVAIALCFLAMTVVDYLLGPEDDQ